MLSRSIAILSWLSIVGGMTFILIYMFPFRLGLFSAPSSSSSSGRVCAAVLNRHAPESGGVLLLLAAAAEERLSPSSAIRRCVPQRRARRTKIASVLVSEK